MFTNAIAPDKLGGLERYVRELSRTLVARGIEVTILCKRVDPSSPQDETADDGVRIVRHDVPPKSRPTFALEYPFRVAAAVLRPARRAQREPGTVLHAHFPTTALPLALGRPGSVPYLYTFHAPVHLELLSERQSSYVLPRRIGDVAANLLRAAEQRIVRRASRLVVLSNFTRSLLAGLDVDAGRRADLVPGGVDLDRFTRSEDGLAAPPLRMPIGPGPVLFSARRLTPRTGVRELIQAMPNVIRDIPGATLVVAGNGGMRGELEALLYRLGLTGTVHLLGRITDDELVRWYRAADLVVMPTQELEGFGLTTVEALASGTPVLGTPIGATPEILRPLDRSLISSDATPAGLARAIIGLLRDPDNLKRLARLTGPHAQGYGWSSVAASYLGIYDSIGSIKRAGT